MMTDGICHHYLQILYCISSGMCDLGQLISQNWKSGPDGWGLRPSSGMCDLGQRSRCPQTLIFPLLAFPSTAVQLLLPRWALDRLHSATDRTLVPASLKMALTLYLQLWWDGALHSVAASIHHRTLELVRTLFLWAVAIVWLMLLDLSQITGHVNPQVAQFSSVSPIFWILYYINAQN